MFKKVVKQAFSQRRKMLRNTMKMFVKDSQLMQDAFFQTTTRAAKIGRFCMADQLGGGANSVNIRFDGISKMGFSLLSL